MQAGRAVDVNIGVITPAPGSAALLGLGALAAIRRRR
ncbi:MAG: PEP-CTERM sorting domain-containing protein [Phycisphaerales bacterium]|nr:PEP-CTERM sorting domain-containing protein [Phycisphaerales bacterium]